MTKPKNSTTPRNNIYLSKAERLALLNAHANRCDHCGKKNRRLHAHHADYAEKPSAVLCPKCHKRLHAGEFNPKVSKKLARFTRIIYKFIREMDKADRSQ